MYYEQIYNKIYSENYDKLENDIKRYFLIKSKKKKYFGKIYNDLSTCLSGKYLEKFDYLLNNEKLNNLYKLFQKKHEHYYEDIIDEIFKNEIKNEFEKIPLSEKPNNYSFLNLVTDIAKLDVRTEISRTLSNNSRIIERIYLKKEFDLFEIRSYNDLSIDNYPVVVKLNLIDDPDYYKKYSDTDTNLYLGEPTNQDASLLFDFLAEFYKPNNISHVKFVNILHFLKNDVDKNKYIYNYMQKEYANMVFKKFNIQIKKFAKSEKYLDKEKPILNKLESSFRETKSSF